MDISPVDLTNPDLYVEGIPHEIFADLRRRAPVCWHPETEGPGFWVVTRYEDVVAVNRDCTTFSSHRRGALLPELPEEQLAQQRLMMLNMDPPMHTRYRLLVNKGFTPRMVNNLADRLRAFTTDILDRAFELGTCDFVTDIAAELPLQAIAEIIGVPQEDRHKVFDWSNRMVGNQDPEYGITAEDAQAASMELFAYCHALVEEKKASPGDDLITVLLNAEVDGHRLSELELDMFFLLLSVAGNETTRNLISHGMLAFFEHPDQWRRLLDDPGLLPSAVEEMLRWGTPVMQFRRTATTDTQIAGQPIREGDKVVIWYISANRDERVFPDPFRFDIARTPNEHVAFGGGGPHYCLGANLARLEIRIMFEELLRRAPHIEQAGEAQRLRSNFINGIKHLPVRLAA